MSSPTEGALLIPLQRRQQSCGSDPLPPNHFPQAFVQTSPRTSCIFPASADFWLSPVVPQAPYNLPDLHVLICGWAGQLAVDAHLGEHIPGILCGPTQRVPGERSGLSLSLGLTTPKEPSPLANRWSFLWAPSLGPRSQGVNFSQRHILLGESHGRRPGQASLQPRTAPPWVILSMHNRRTSPGSPELGQALGPMQRRTHPPLLLHSKPGENSVLGRDSPSSDQAPGGSRERV